MLCWICGAFADSKEHIFKKSDLTRAFGKKPYNKSVVHVKNSKKFYLQGADSNKVKYVNSLCRKCNGSFSQPFDKAYDVFVVYIYTNEKEILHKRFIDFYDVYGDDFELHCRYLYKYFAKSFGCRVADLNQNEDNNIVPQDVKNLLFKTSFRTGLRLNFSVHEDILMMPSEHRDGFLGKADLMGWHSKDEPVIWNGFSWSEHVSWLYINYWYMREPDGWLGSSWVADSRFIYLGSFYSSLTDEQREKLNQNSLDKSNE